MLQHNCSAVPILCTTSNSTMTLPALYHVVLAFHLVSGIKHARAVWCRLENVAVLAIIEGSFDKAIVTLVIC